ncbi:hypothetical protein D3C86_1770340 [compost metagenome]
MAVETPPLTTVIGSISSKDLADASEGAANSRALHRTAQFAVKRWLTASGYDAVIVLSTQPSNSVLDIFFP